MCTEILNHWNTYITVYEVGGSCGVGCEVTDVWDVTLSNLVEIYHHFGGTWCLHL